MTSVTVCLPGREEFLDAFGELAARFDVATGGTAVVPSVYLIVTVRR